VRDEAKFKEVNLTVPIPVQQEGSRTVPRFEPYILKMERGRPLNGTGYSLYTANLHAKPAGDMYVAIMSYGLSGKGGLRVVEVPFVLWKGLKGCPL
jgi:hypothetical protein